MSLDNSANPWRLSTRQCEVMDALASTGCNKMAARALRVGITTIEAHSAAARRSMRAPNRTLALLAWDRFRRQS